MRYLIIIFTSLILGGCIDQDKAKIVEQRWELELETFRKSAEFELSKLKEKKIDKALVNEEYYRGGGVNRAEAEAACGQLQKFYFHFRSTGINDANLFGDLKPREKKVIYCSRDRLTADPVYGNKSVSNISKTISNINELTDTNYSVLQAEIWGKNKIKNVESQVNTMSNIKKICKEFGFKEATEKYAECLKDLYLKENTQQQSTQSIIVNDSGSQAIADEMKRQRNQQTTNELLNLSRELSKGKSLGEIYGGAPPKSGGTGGSCTLTNSVMSGTNRICYYKCGVSTQTSNVGAAQQCPLTM